MHTRTNSWKQGSPESRLPASSSLISNTRDENGDKWRPSSAAKIKTVVRNMYKYKDALSIYKAFYQQIVRLDLFEFKPNSALEYADLFPLIYSKMHLEGVWTQEKVKYILVDEMQDLRASAVYRIIPMVPVQKNASQRWLPNCQSVDSSTLEDIRCIFPEDL
ncbi:hypothetical protein [Brevibacillus borstelensis]|uniref:hypothetical protein n=1 Tax=Brevibacillus borstelensis TaxID=45462 RepID=UPI0030BCD2BD